jgi:hypothetical protein
MPLLNATTANTMLDAGIEPGATYYMSLHSGSPSTSGANEISGGSYERQAIVFGDADEGMQASTIGVTFSSLPAVSGGLPYFGIWTSSEGGDFTWGGTTTGLTDAIAAGSVISFPAGNITTGDA